MDDVRRMTSSFTQPKADNVGAETITLHSEGQKVCFVEPTHVRFTASLQARRVFLDIRHFPNFRRRQYSRALNAARKHLDKRLLNTQSALEALPVTVSTAPYALSIVRVSLPGLKGMLGVYTVTVGASISGLTDADELKLALEQHFDSMGNSPEYFVDSEHPSLRFATAEAKKNSLHQAMEQAVARGYHNVSAAHFTLRSINVRARHAHTDLVYTPHGLSIAPPFNVTVTVSALWDYHETLPSPSPSTTSPKPGPTLKPSLASIELDTKRPIKPMQGSSRHRARTRRQPQWSSKSFPADVSLETPLASTGFARTYISSRLSEKEASDTAQDAVITPASGMPSSERLNVEAGNLEAFKEALRKEHDRVGASPLLSPLQQPPRRASERQSPAPLRTHTPGRHDGLLSTPQHARAFSEPSVFVPGVGESYEMVDGRLVEASPILGVESNDGEPRPDIEFLEASADDPTFHAYPWEKR